MFELADVFSSLSELISIFLFFEKKFKYKKNKIENTKMVKKIFITFGCIYEILDCKILCM